MRNRALALLLFSILFAAAAPTFGSSSGVPAAPAQSVSGTPAEAAASSTPCPTGSAESAAPSASGGGAGAAPAESTVPESSGSPGPQPCATPIDLAPYLTAELTLVNLGTETVTANILIVDPDTKESQALASQTVEPQGFVSEKVLPLPYTIEFSKAGADKPYATCTVTITDIQVFDFAALDDAVAVSLRGATPTDPNELWTDTSSLCRPQSSEPSSQPS